MQPDRYRVDQARAVREKHLWTCRSCTSSGTCQSAKLLRRTYNSLLRAFQTGYRLPKAGRS